MQRHSEEMTSTRRVVNLAMGTKTKSTTGAERVINKNHKDPDDVSKAAKTPSKVEDEKTTHTVSENGEKKETSNTEFYLFLLSDIFQSMKSDIEKAKQMYADLLQKKEEFILFTSHVNRHFSTLCKLFSEIHPKFVQSMFLIDQLFKMAKRDDNHLIDPRFEAFFQQNKLRFSQLDPDLNLFRPQHMNHPGREMNAAKSRLPTTGTALHSRL